MDGLSKKNPTGIWSSFFPKISSYSLDRKWKIIFLKKVHGNMIFSSNVLKRWSFQKNPTGIWSFLYYLERRYFFFLEIWSYSLDGKWKMIFLKKTHGNMIFFSNVPKRDKSILIHVCQHKSTRINTSPTRVNMNQTNPTRVNTRQTWVNTNQHESDTSQHESIRPRNYHSLS